MLSHPAALTRVKAEAVDQVFSVKMSNFLASSKIFGYDKLNLGNDLGKTAVGISKSGPM